MSNSVSDKKLYGTATVGSKGQVVIPSEARDELNIQPGDRLYVVSAMNGAGVVLLKEEKLSEMVEKFTTQADIFRSLQEVNKKEK